MYRPHLPPTGSEGTARGTDIKMACPIPAPQPLDRETRQLFRVVNTRARPTHPRLYLWIIQGGYQVLFGQDPDAQITRAWDIRRSWFMTTPQPGWRGEYADALRRVLDAEAEAAPPLAPA